MVHFIFETVFGFVRTLKTLFLHDLWTLYIRDAWKTSKGGEGHFQSKNFLLQIFAVILRGEKNEFSEKSGGSLQAEKFRCRF